MRLFGQLKNSSILYKFQSIVSALLQESDTEYNADINYNADIYYGGQYDFVATQLTAGNKSQPFSANIDHLGKTATIKPAHQISKIKQPPLTARLK